MGVNNTTPTVLDEATRLPSPPPGVVGPTKCVMGAVGGGVQCVVPTHLPPRLEKAKLGEGEGGWVVEAVLVGFAVSPAGLDSPWDL